jgi:hypothetical protein
MAGMLIENGSASSETVASPSASRARIARLLINHCVKRRGPAAGCQAARARAHTTNFVEHPELVAERAAETADTETA